MLFLLFAVAGGVIPVDAGCLTPPISTASDPIIKMSGLTVESAVFEKQHLQQPLVIRSREDSSGYFVEKSVQTLVRNVDFDNYVVLLFAWRGSGQDRLDYTVQESYPETIQFSIQPGRSRDMRQHAQVYAVRSNVTVRVNGQEISLSPRADADEFVRVEIRGRLNAQVMAIGGETTGIVIQAGNIQWELNVRDATMRQRCEQLHEQTVIVRGTLRRKPGVEIAERWIVDVEGLESVAK